MTLPAKLDEIVWEHLDFLGWRDPKDPARAYLVVRRDGNPLGLALRTTPERGPRRGSGLCNICYSAHPLADVALFAARKSGAAGRAGNTVGTYVCGDLACSLYVRGLRELELPQGEMISTEARIARLEQRLAAFVDRVLAA
jgi:hypothetical protein